jgi:hypothetical protein
MYLDKMIEEECKKYNTIAIRETFYTMFLRNEENKIIIKLSFSLPKDDEIDIVYLEEIHVEKYDTKEEVILTPYSIVYTHRTYYLKNDWSDIEWSEMLPFFQHSDELIQLLNDLLATKTRTLFNMFKEYLIPSPELELEFGGKNVT